jgi:hypothetical protein
MAARLDPNKVRRTHQFLHHVVAVAPWNDQLLLQAVRQYVLPKMTGRAPMAAWVVDDTGLPKKDKHSVGVARQSCGPIGKQDNCQVAVSLSVSTNAASLPVAYELYRGPGAPSEGRGTGRGRLPHQTAHRRRTDAAGSRRCGLRQRHQAPQGPAKYGSWIWDWNTWWAFSRCCPYGLRDRNPCRRSFASARLTTNRFSPRILRWVSPHGLEDDLLAQGHKK